MKRLFGTDGVRGKAGVYPLDHETVARLGAALVRAMGPTTGSRPLKFIIGRDTRESGDWIERELGRGVHAEGAAITTRRRHPDAGDRLHHARARVRRRPGDQRLAQSVRGQRHQGVLRPRREVRRRARASTSSRSSPTRAGRCRPAACRRSSAPTSTNAYIAHTRQSLPDPGRAGRIQDRDRHARTARRRPSLRACSASSGSTLTVIGDQPDGRNINLDCGSTHPEQLGELVEAGRPSHGRRVRRRRRSRDLRGSRGPGGGRRRRHADVRAPHEGAGAAQRQRRWSRP